MLERLLRLDVKLFFYINNVWSNPVLDAVVPWLREPYVWAPLYLFLLLFVTINYGWKGFWWAVFFMITFGLSDQSSLHIKDAVSRLRPCRDPLIQQFVRVLVVYCPSSGSFTSSHAANHFALGTFCFFTFRHISKLYASLFFVWAAAICYAQVYVGVHFPLDVLGGAVLGLFIGTMSAGFFQRRIRLEPELTT
jgi:membrane-associated phospholipid phosphatase